MKALGFDVGGTKIEAAVFEFGNQTKPAEFHCALLGSAQNVKTVSDKSSSMPVACLSRARRPTERQKGYAHILQQMKELALEVLGSSQTKQDELVGIGVGLPGAVDPRAQCMLNGNTLVLVGNPLASDLAQALGFKGKVVMGNDANCFALAEHYCGAGLEVAASTGNIPSNMTGVGIILGTGCGGGFVIEGKLFTGARGGAAEVGHTVLRTGGHACYCGMRGCAEQYLSGTALEGHYASRRYSQVENVKSAKDIFEQQSLGEPLAVAVIKSYIEDLSDFLAGLTNALNPDYFVLGGGVSLQPSIYDGLAPKVAEKSFLPGQNPLILKNRVGDSAGVVGAALLPF